MLSNALVLAALTTTAFVVVYKKLPRRVRKWIEKHSLLADAVALILTYVLLGGTLTALVAAALVGLFTSALLYIAQNPDDFVYLRDFSDMVKRSLSGIQNSLKEFGQQYNADAQASASPTEIQK